MIIVFLDKESSTLIFARDLPEQAIIKAIVGRDISQKGKINNVHYSPLLNKGF